MNTARDNEDKKIRLWTSNKYGDIAIVGFGKSVLESVRQLTILPCDELYLIHMKPKLTQLKDKQRRLIIVNADMNESFVRENLLEFLIGLSHQKVCVVMHNVIGRSSLVQEIEKRFSFLNTNLQEERDLKMLTQNLYDIVSHKDEFFNHMEEDKNDYQLRSDTFFKKGNQCYIYSKTNCLSLKKKLEKDALLNQRLENAQHCWLKIAPCVGFENIVIDIEKIDSIIDEDADFFFYGSDENCTTYLLLMM